MLENEEKHLNKFLVESFNMIMKIEETTLRNSSYKDLTLKEFQLLQIAYNRGINDEDNTAGAIARKLKITPGTLTTAVKLLEKKGYIKRVQDNKDKRSVHILVTQKGEKANLENLEYHHTMMQTIKSALTEEEVAAFKKGLTALNQFFIAKE